jgi:predicted permease
MLYNYLIITLRGLRKSKAFSLINLLGLAVGMATSILILLWVQDELSFDNFHPHGDHVYRVVAAWQTNNETQEYAATPAPLAAVLKGEILEIRDVVRLGEGGQMLLTYRDKHFDETGALYADPALLRMFGFPLVKGDPNSALRDPHSVVLTQTLAQKYFPNEEAVGKRIRVNNGADFTVTGVMRDVPANSHLRFSFVVPFELMKESNATLDNNWMDYNYTTYVQLHPGTPAAGVDGKLAAVFRRRNPDTQGRFYLEPMRRIYLYSKVPGDNARHGDAQSVYIFSAVAVFILLIASINYMNLATARSARRAKEVGLRKVAGANRGQLIGQFLGESVLLACVALGLALVLVWALLPVYSDITEKVLSMNMLLGNTLLALLAIAVCTGLVAGSYPALMLSAFQPVRVLKGTLSAGRGGAAFRRGLVVVQFTLSILLIFSTLVIYRQMQYVQTKNLGFEKENILTFVLRGDLNRKYETVRGELLRQPGVVAVTSASQDLTNVNSSTGGGDWEGKPAESRLILNQLSVDRDFTDAFNLRMVAGRGFSRQYATDSAAFILNEEAVRQMGLQSPVGKRFSAHNVTGTIVGVAEDFHFKSLHEPIEPMVLFVSPNWRGQAYVKIKPGYEAAAVAACEKVWKTFNPSYPFAYRFLDENFDRMYRAEQRAGRLFRYFAGIAIFIACLGLFGLAAYTAEQRVREIGIRKVLGASVSSLVTLLSREFVVLVIISFALAVPLGWYLMNGWLSDFAYRIRLSWWLFAVAGGLAAVIALLTVSFQSIKAALADPVHSLKSE